MRFNKNNYLCTVLEFVSRQSCIEIMGLLQERLKKYDLPQQYMAKGVYPYFREIDGKQDTEVNMGGHKVLMFGSNAYTGLTSDPRVIAAGIKALEKYGSG